MALYSDWQRIHPIYGVPIAAVEATEQPSIQCNLVRDNQPLLKSSITISTWLNTNYLLWLLCAGHADSGIDEQWTIAFESKHRWCWNEIQARVQEIDGPYRFGLVVRPPPVFSAVITHIYENDPVNYSFRICAEDCPSYLAPPATEMPRNGVWGFWQFLAEREAFFPDSFNVVLETWQTVASSLPYSTSFEPSSLSSPSLSVETLPTYSRSSSPPPSYSEY
jgi:hypothetical protein